jgi:hypothetical protein
MSTSRTDNFLGESYTLVRYDATRDYQVPIGQVMNGDGSTTRPRPFQERLGLAGSPRQRFGEFTDSPSVATRSGEPTGFGVVFDLGDPDEWKDSGVEFVTSAHLAIFGERPSPTHDEPRHGCSVHLLVAEFWGQVPAAAARSEELSSCDVVSPSEHDVVQCEADVEARDGVTGLMDRHRAT